MCIKKLVNNMMDMARGFGFWDFAIFKLTVAAAALTIAKLFPVLLSASIWVYIAIWVIGGMFLMRNFKWK